DCDRSAVTLPRVTSSAGPRPRASSPPGCRTGARCWWRRRKRQRESVGRSHGGCGAMTLERVDLDRVAGLLRGGAEAMETCVDPAECDDARELGKRLRIVRRQRGLSLEQVESTSADEFKAAVLGAYERGERAISVARLRRLARFYGVPVDYLLSEQADASAPGTALLSRPQPSRERLVVDLRRLRD